MWVLCTKRNALILLCFHWNHIASVIRYLVDIGIAPKAYSRFYDISTILKVFLPESGQFLCKQHYFKFSAANDFINEAFAVSSARKINLNSPLISSIWYKLREPTRFNITKNNFQRQRRTFPFLYSRSMAYSCIVKSKNSS